MGANYNCFFIAAIFVSIMVLSYSMKTGNSIESDEEERSDESVEKSSNIIQKLREQIKIKEDELENAEKINKNFERMIQLVNIMGQVDTFLTDRTRLVLRKLAMLADDMETPMKKSGSHNIKF